jgi:dienelactone hydrolase
MKSLAFTLPGTCHSRDGGNPDLGSSVKRLMRQLCSLGLGPRRRGNDKIFMASFIGTMALTASCATYAELVKIPAPHIGEDKTLRAQWFAPDAKIATGAAAILLHGCGGVGAKRQLNARHAAAKDWLLERGIAVVFPESFTSRSFEEVCTVKMSARTIRQIDRVEDVIATRKWLDAQPGVDAKKVILWGWSHGGSTVLNTVTHRSMGGLGEFPAEVKFAEAIAFYPGCSPFARNGAAQKIASPLTVLMGDADDWTPAAPCETFVARLKNNDQPATITLYPGAYHDFDNPAGKLRVRADVPNGVNTGKGVTVGPDPKAREDAMARIDALLRKRGLAAAAVASATPAAPATKP